MKKESCHGHHDRTDRAGHRPCGLEPGSRRRRSDPRCRGSLGTRDALYARRAEIEQAVGAAGTVSWEPLDETAKRASRVAIYHPGHVYDEPEIVPALTEWGAETLANLVKVTKPILCELRIQLAHTQ